MIRKWLLMLALLPALIVISGMASASHNDQHRTKATRTTERTVPPAQDAHRIGSGFHRMDTSRPCRFLGGPKNNLIECR